MKPPESALDELATWTGEPLEELERWLSLGLLPDGPTVPLSHRLERVRLIRFALQRGYTPERLAEIAVTHGDMIGQFAEQIGGMVGEPVGSVADVAQRGNVDPELFESLRRVSGLGDEHFATNADLSVLTLIKTALDGGLPPEVLTQMVRVFADSTHKIADAGSRLFHMYVHEQMRATGSGGAELLQATNLLSAPLLALVEPAVVYYHDKAWQRALREDMMLHLAEETTAPSSVPGEFTRAVLFADLSRFTPLTEVMGDVAAAEVVARFSEIVRIAVARCSGQVVKQIGDEFMLVFAGAVGAAACGLELRKLAAAEPRFPALRIGAHVGSVLYREGDYVGTTVNVAARVAGSAGRNQFLVTREVREQLGDLDVTIVAVGSRLLKGLSEEKELFELQGEAAAVRAADPVCGMELDEPSAAAQLNRQNERILFCSQECLRRFVVSPEKYRAAVTE